MDPNRENLGLSASGLVTLVTQGSMERVNARLLQVVEAWGCAVSVAVYMPAPKKTNQVKQHLVELTNLANVMKSRDLTGVKISVLYANEATSLEGMVPFKCANPNDCQVEELKQQTLEEYDKLYPVNALRNLALSVVATPLVLMVDMDFVPSPTLCMSLEGGGDEGVRQAALYAASQAQMAQGVALVVPAFEIFPDSPLPVNQGELKTKYDSGEVVFFHQKSFPRGHNLTDFPKWWGAREPYFVKYAVPYEPYIIAPTFRLPKFDERFRGFGYNKIQQLWHTAALDFKFLVLPTEFLVHVNHRKTFNLGYMEKYKGADGLPIAPRAVYLEHLYNNFRLHTRELLESEMAIDKVMFGGLPKPLMESANARLREQAAAAEAKREAAAAHEAVQATQIQQALSMLDTAGIPAVKGAQVHADVDQPVHLEEADPSREIVHPQHTMVNAGAALPVLDPLAVAKPAGAMSAMDKILAQAEREQEAARRAALNPTAARKPGAGPEGEALPFAQFGLKPVNVLQQQQQTQAQPEGSGVGGQQPLQGGGGLEQPAEAAAVLPAGGQGLALPVETAAGGMMQQQQQPQFGALEQPQFGEVQQQQQQQPQFGEVQQQQQQQQPQFGEVQQQQQQQPQFGEVQQQQQQMMGGGEGAMPQQTTLPGAASTLPQFDGV